MRCRVRHAQPGKEYIVQHAHVYPLPDGLNPGDLVRAVRFECGYWTVEKEGRVFKAFVACMQTGHEYELAPNRWFPETDWRVQARLRDPRERVSERAKIIANGAFVPEANV